MNILFLTLLDFESITEHNIYTDLLREFIKRNHELYVISPIERRKGHKTYLVQENNSTILKLKIGNIQKTNLIEKGISTIQIESQFIYGIKHYFSNVKFELILYSTPPITFCDAIRYVKKRDGATTYLLLKDIFPQNAVDIGLMSKTGIKSLIYKYFRKKEKNLYQISDVIGCMSEANVKYVIQNNPEIDSKLVEVCPNSISPIDKSLDDNGRIIVREKYGIPKDKIVYIYGGNLGKPQDIEFVINCLKSQKNSEEAFFLIVGNGTEFCKLEAFVNNSSQKNIKLMQSLPKDEYDMLVGACDIGMIFLDHRFTIPNFPSRLLGYMQAKIPVIALTDSNTDIGEIINEGRFGFWDMSDNVQGFTSIVENLNKNELKEMGNNAFEYLINNFSADNSYKIIERHL